MKQEMLYQFTATNHEGLRLTWYFDLEDQAKRAHLFGRSFEFADATELAHAPVNVDTRGHVYPPGVAQDDYDIITDAGEFGRWLTGNDDDDGLAVMLAPESCSAPPDPEEITRLFTALSKLGG